jgi:DNA-binding transcriptional regulator YiaG
MSRQSRNNNLINSISDSKVINMKAWLPEEIEALRKKHRLTRRAFSELLGVAGNHVYLLERGLREPSNTLRLLLNCVEKQLNEKRKESKKRGKAQRAL